MAVVIVFPFKLIGQQYLKYFVPPTLEKSVQIKKCGFLQTLPPMIGTCLLNMQFFNSEGFPKLNKFNEITFMLGDNSEEDSRPCKKFNCFCF